MSSAVGAGIPARLWIGWRPGNGRTGEQTAAREWPHLLLHHHHTQPIMWQGLAPEVVALGRTDGGQQPVKEKPTPANRSGSRSRTSAR
ncbi:MAG: hypothetical protein ACOYMV_06315 [Verrucomicrobiia bacterium]